MKIHPLKKMSVKSKITLWYTLLILVICLFALWLLLSAAHRSVRQYCEDTLVNAAIILQDELEIEHGYLEIDDDIDDVPNVYASLFKGDGTLIYGRYWLDAPFVEGSVHTANDGRHTWYLYDVPISVPGWEGTWLRLHMSADELSSLRQAALHLGFWFLPLFAAIALGGGHWVTTRVFRPVQRMNDLASSIANGNDLSARLELDPEISGDELHHLGSTINGMLSRLEAAFKREQRFTSDAAHELRTPLNRMITQGEYALSRTQADEKDEAIAQMLKTARDMSHTAQQLLMMARLEAGQLERSDRCQMDILLAEIAEDMQPIAEERGMTIATQLASCEMILNRAMLTRAVVNLLDNAVRYGRENGRIELVSVLEADELCITVRDDGPGLTQEELPHVFTRFWRADSSRSASGTGIGLSLASSIAKAHGGSICAASAAGEGAAFTIRLPLEKN